MHTNPDFSTAGLEAVVAEYYAATGKKEGLTEQDVDGSKARKIVRDIERSIVHYGDTTLFIADQMREQGPGYASAVAMEEVTLLDFNKRRGTQPKLVALYPPEGTFYSDNPFIVLDARLGHAGPARRGRALPAVPRRRARRPRTRRAPASGRPTSTSEPVAPITQGQRRRPQAARRACSACPSRARSTASGAPGARTASRPTCCWSSTRPAR